MIYMNLPKFNFFTQSFVSLVFTPSKIQIAKLNNARDKVEVLAEAEIPPGIIASYRVNNKEELVKRIKTLWARQKIHEKFVGVVVPEFATYTKSVTLPNLNNAEIDEALVWQLEEFLPSNLSDVIVDWKIIKRTPENVEVLVAAILKDVLYGYIDAVGEAGFSPLVVETPSLSLERITHLEDKAQLLIHVASPEATIVITEGERVVASSVVTSQNVNIIVNTALQMMSHYSSLQISGVIVSGPDLNQDLIQNLHNNIGMPVELFKKNLAGLDMPNLQKYLLAVSLQYKTPDEPASETTINLLPPAWAKIYNKKQKFVKYWTLTLVVSIFTWMTFLASFIVMMLLALQTQDLTRDASGNGSGELATLATEVRAANTIIDKYIQVKESIYPFQEVANKIGSVARNTTGVAILNYKINLDTGEVTITGNAIDRNSLVNFKDAVAETEGFSDVDVPISFVLKETDIDFEMKLKVTDLVREKKAAPVKLNI